MKRICWLLLISLCSFLAGCVPFAGVAYEASGRVVRVDDESVGVADVRLYFNGIPGIVAIAAGEDFTLAVDCYGDLWHCGWAYPGTSIYHVRSRPTRIGQV